MVGNPRALLAAVLGIVGGVFVTLGGLVLWASGTVLARTLGLSSPWFLVGALDGLVAIAVGCLLLALPRFTRALGAVLLACAAVSVPFAFGGLVVGLFLTAIGGAIAAARRPRGVAVAVSPENGRPPPWT